MVIVPHSKSQVSKTMTSGDVNLFHSVIMIGQGTAGVTLAGLLGAVRAKGLPISEIANQRIVVAGAGR